MILTSIIAFQLALVALSDSDEDYFCSLATTGYMLPRLPYIEYHKHPNIRLDMRDYHHHMS